MIVRRIAVLLFLLTPTLAFSQVRTFVSTSGLDNITCARTEPCRTFNAAIDAVQAGGEVVVLDSGGYGPAAIDKSVSIISPLGLHASIAPTAGPGLDIAAANTDKIVIRNLNLTLLGGGPGINADSFRSLFIEDCTITNSGSFGIDLSANAVNSKVFITSTRIRGSANAGLIARSLAGSFVVALSETQSLNNGGQGFQASSGSLLYCTDCEAIGNGGIGFHLFTDIPSAGTTELNCDRCVSNRNLEGFRCEAFSGAVGTMRVARSSAVGNSSAGLREGALGAQLILLAGTNMIDGNSPNKDGGITTIAAE